MPNPKHLTRHEALAMLDSWPCVQNCDNGAIEGGHDSQGHQELLQCQFCDERAKVRAAIVAVDDQLHRAIVLLLNSRFKYRGFGHPENYDRKTWEGCREELRAETTDA